MKSGLTLKRQGSDESRKKTKVLKSRVSEPFKERVVEFCNDNDTDEAELVRTAVKWWMAKQKAA